jgi:hypothetical protein
MDFQRSSWLARFVFPDNSLERGLHMNAAAVRSTTFGIRMGMMRAIGILALSILGTASVASAATIVDFSGVTNGSLASGTASITLDAGGTFITGTVTNTAPFDARLTGFGFDLFGGDPSGYTGSPNPITLPAGVTFNFQDDGLGNVPEINNAVLDFGYITGPNFPGGDPNSGLDNFQTLSFMVSGAFAGLTEAEIASALIVRFQRVGENGQLSDVAAAGSPLPLSPVPEPASMLLVGSGLAYLARRRHKSGQEIKGL